MTIERDEQMLESAFADLRVDDLAPSEDLMNRIMLDADMVLAQAATKPATTAAPSRWSMVLDMLGGWPSVSGLAAATVAGLWIGVVQPTAFTDLSAGLWGSTVEVPLLESDVFAGLEG